MPLIIATFSEQFDLAGCHFGPGNDFDASKEHGGKRLEEEVEALRMSSINIFHVLDISSEASNLQGITWRRQEFRKSGRKGGRGRVGGETGCVDPGDVPEIMKIFRPARFPGYTKS